MSCAVLLFVALAFGSIVLVNCFLSEILKKIDMYERAYRECLTDTVVRAFILPCFSCETKVSGRVVGRLNCTPATTTWTHQLERNA